MSDPFKQPILNQIQTNATATGTGLTFKAGGSIATVQVQGITTATVAIEVTLDGTHWVASGLSFTADGVGTINGYFTSIRANISAYTSGTINVWIIG